MPLHLKKKSEKLSVSYFGMLRIFVKGIDLQGFSSIKNK